MPREPKPPATTSSSVIDNPWRALRRHTPARIGLGRAGVSLPTAAQLDFQLAHAQARDAVHRPLDVAALRGEIEALGLPTLALHSAASTRPIYLQRPDLGRQLGAASREQLEALRSRRQAQGGAPHDIAIVIADGLSALAVQRHAAPLIAALRAEPAAARWSIAPVAVVEQGRVAVGDGIGELLDARIAVVLIGERPGLSSPDSLGIYLTWAPRIGRHDAERNCLSNVRPEGLGYAQAAARLAYLLDEALRRGLTGVGLKDESGAAGEAIAAQPNFLLGER
ncbi:ethanolamine ammonia-lyase subunit EutC [Variovorax sp. YR752]|uniref:ethanolamine ammonia-lyase subunit EutC n=1 Tax=Variovorax sp. YR752 TaxID=1884383 RepID=UPI003137ECC8